MRQERDYRLNLRTQRIVCAIVDDYDNRARLIAEHGLKRRTEANYIHLNNVIDSALAECCKGWCEAQIVQIRMEIGANDGYRSSFVSLSRRNYYLKKQQIRYAIAKGLYLI